MTDIQMIFDRLNDLEAEIARFGRSQTQVVTPSERIALKSLEKRREELQTALADLSAQQLVDLCDYRIMPTERNRYPVRAVANALSGFQETITNFYGALRDKPKERARFDADIVAGSTLNVGYAYAGSLGFVLFAFNDDLLPESTALDQAVQGVLELAQQRDVEGVKRFNERFGKSSIRSFYNWSKTHIDNGFDVDIKWQRGGETKVERVVQLEELRQVRTLIEAASDSTTETHSFVGVLFALDVAKQTFGFSPASGANDVVRGRLDAEFDTKSQWKAPGTYRATVLKTVIHRFYTDEDMPTWTLLKLEELV